MSAKKKLPKSKSSAPSLEPELQWARGLWGDATSLGAALVNSKQAEQSPLAFLLALEMAKEKMLEQGGVTLEIVYHQCKAQRAQLAERAIEFSIE